MSPCVGLYCQYTSTNKKTIPFLGSPTAAHDGAADCLDSAANIALDFHITARAADVPCHVLVNRNVAARRRHVLRCVAFDTNIAAGGADRRGRPFDQNLAAHRVDGSLGVAFDGDVHNDRLARREVVLALAVDIDETVHD